MAAERSAEKLIEEVELCRGLRRLCDEEGKEGKWDGAEHIEN